MNTQFRELVSEVAVNISCPKGLKRGGYCDDLVDVQYDKPVTFIDDLGRAVIVLPVKGRDNIIALERYPDDDLVVFQANEVMYKADETWFTAGFSLFETDYSYVIRSLAEDMPLPNIVRYLLTKFGHGDVEVVFTNRAKDTTVPGLKGGPRRQDDMDKIIKFCEWCLQRFPDSGNDPAREVVSRIVASPFSADHLNGVWAPLGAAAAYGWVSLYKAKTESDKEELFGMLSSIWRSWELDLKEVA